MTEDWYVTIQCFLGTEPGWQELNVEVEQRGEVGLTGVVSLHLPYAYMGDPRRNMKIIVMGYHDIGHACLKELLDAGADAYLIKPFQFKTLFEHVENLLGLKDKDKSGTAFSNPNMRLK